MLQLQFCLLKKQPRARRGRWGEAGGGEEPVALGADSAAPERGPERRGGLGTSPDWSRRVRVIKGGRAAANSRQQGPEVVRGRHGVRAGGAGMLGSPPPVSRDRETLRWALPPEPLVPIPPSICNHLSVIAGKPGCAPSHRRCQRSCVPDSRNGFDMIQSQPLRSSFISTEDQRIRGTQIKV